MLPRKPLSARRLTCLIFSISSASFSATTVSVKAESEAGKAYLESLYGAGAVSVELRKGFVQEWADKANAAGLKVRA